MSRVDTFLFGFAIGLILGFGTDPFTYWMGAAMLVVNFIGFGIAQLRNYRREREVEKLDLEDLRRRMEKNFEG